MGPESHTFISNCGLATQPNYMLDICANITEDFLHQAQQLEVTTKTSLLLKIQM